MIKYLVQHKITKCFRIAFRITHISDENKYLKEKYNFLASACDVGKFLIVDEGTGIHFVLSGYAFYEGYDIVKRTVMYPAIPFTKSGDDFKSEIDKRREIFSGNVYDWLRNEIAKPVYISTDILPNTHISMSTILTKLPCIRISFMSFHFGKLRTHPGLPSHILIFAK